MISEKEGNSNKDTLLIWQRIAKSFVIFAAISAAILSTLLIANYVQIKTNDPISNQVIAQLMTELQDNPDDVVLQEQIRALDLLARKAYFTYQWQVRTGAYLLFSFVLLLLLALKFFSSLQSRLPNLDEEIRSDESWESQLLSRKYVLFGGLGFFILALILGLVSQSGMDDIDLVTQEDLTSSASTDLDVSTPVLEPNLQVPEDSSAEIIEDEIAITAPEIEVSSPSTGLEEIGANWPGFRGPAGNGVAIEAEYPILWDGSSGENILWKTPIPLPGFNSPIIWGNRIFLSGADENTQVVYCLDADSGELLWQVELNDITGSPDTQPNVGEDTGYAAPTMTTDGERVFVLFANGDIACLDMEGQRIWAKNLGMPDNIYGHASSLISYQDILIVPFDQHTGGRLLGLRTTTGDVAFDQPRDVDASWASPILVNTGARIELILSATPFVMSHDPLTGRELWRVQCMLGEVAPSPAYADGMVYAVNEYARLVGIKLQEEPEVVWESLDDLSEVASPVATDELVFVPTSFGTISCFDSKTGERYWYHDFDEGFYSSPILVGDRVYALDVLGKMSVFKAQREFELVSENDLGESAMTVPAFMHNRIYIRGENHLFSIGR